MKSCVLLILLFFTFKHIEAQKVRLFYAINSIGASATNGPISLEWNVGETGSVQTIGVPQFILTEGLLQADRASLFGSGYKVSKNTFELKLTPIPCDNLINLESKIPGQTDAQISIYDISGREVRRFKVVLSKWMKNSFDLKDLPKGSYYMVVVYSMNSIRTETRDVLRFVKL